jgi:hypothetical protein
MQDEVRVERYNGDKALERGLQRMKAKGWSVQSVNTRKAAFSAMTGVFTRKQVHTVTFAKGAADALTDHFWNNKDEILAKVTEMGRGKPASEQQRRYLSQLFAEREIGDDPVLQQDRSADPALDVAEAAELIGGSMPSRIGRACRARRSRVRWTMKL